MNKQQEFLDTLKDPTLAKINKVCDAFQDIVSDIKSINIIQTRGAYAIHVVAETSELLELTKDTFRIMLHEQSFKPFNSVYNQSNPVELVDGDYVLGFYVIK